MVDEPVDERLRADEEHPMDVARERIPRPRYGAAADSDWMGSNAVAIMLEDLKFPQTAGELRERVALWQVPVKGSEETVALGRLLQPFGDRQRFGSAEEVAKAIAREFPEF